MARRLPFDGLDGSFRVHVKAVGLHEEDEIARRIESDVSDRDVSVVGHLIRRHSCRTGKGVEVGDEVLRSVRTQELLDFFLCHTEL